MKCAFKDCMNEPCGSKQFNDIYVRAYLCRVHLIKVAELSSINDGMRFIEMLGLN